MLPKPLPPPNEKGQIIYLDMEAVCEGCGSVGAYVFYDKGQTIPDVFCANCLGISVQAALKRKGESDGGSTSN